MNKWPAPAIFNATSTRVRGLTLINTGGIIHEDPVHASPSIVFRASNPDLVRALTVNQNEGPNGDTLELQFSSRQDVAGDYLLEIYMPSNSLQYVHAGDGGSTVVGPNTLIVDSSRDIGIKSSGSSTIFVESDNIGSSSFMVETVSTGDIQINVNNVLAADVIDLSSQGSGDILLLAGNTAATSLVTVAEGSGSVFVGANPTTTDPASTSITATNLITKVFGDGNVVYLNDGTCDSSFVETSGAGSAFMSSMRCHDTGAVLLEKGNIYATATDSFSIEDRGTGEVYALVDAATNVTGTYYPFPDTVPSPSYTVMVVPDRTPTSIEIKGAAPADLVQYTRKPQSTGSKALGSGSIAAIVLALVVLIAFAAVVFVRRRIKARQPRQAKVDFTTEVEFVSIETPAAEVAEAKVLSMQTA
ncbi:hypothetical protein DYB32_002853 [Aphanomyces invadans]|uniref:Uncharacterized protein n=1 Tax=Aphanomyces invadans TaxID=157072 RepID=A0A418B230_9STRA|nr:hypothetical protein DYB32_002853 [Aphanomyces invadans]